MLTMQIVSNGLTATCSAGEVRVLSLSNIISTFNTKNVSDHEMQHAVFMSAFHFLYEILESQILIIAQRVKDRIDFPKFAEIKGGVAILDILMHWKEIVHKDYPDVRFVIHESNHPGAKYCMIAVPVTPTSREIHIPIERPNWFKGFIHQRKWIAGSNSVEELERLANYNLER